MPRNITVTFEDGSTHVYQNAPDGVTPEQVSVRAAQEFGKGVSSLDGGRKPSAVKQFSADAVGGLVRGAGSIGATLLYPIDKATDIIRGDRGPNVTGLVTGQQPKSRNEERRAAMDAGLQELLGADPESLTYQGGKLAGEIAGTAGVGGGVANVVGRVAPRAAAAAPNLLSAIRTSGMQGGNMLTRAAGGATAGGASAGLVNPEDALTGAVVGGAVPGVAKAAGWAGNKIGAAVRGPTQSPDLAAAVKSARDAGYVIPPTQANASLSNRMIEGFSGKLTTAQNASAKNAGVTADLAAKAIGLPAGTKITPEVLDSVRAEAGKAYGAIAQLGPIEVKGVKLPQGVSIETFIDPLIGGKSARVDSAELVRAWKQSNHDATAYYRAYGRDANPETLAKAKSAASDAKRIDEFMNQQIEKMSATGLDEKARAVGKIIEDLKKAGLTGLSEKLEKAGGVVGALGRPLEPELITNLKNARRLIAKTHSIEGALNPTAGAIDARKLAHQLQKGKPLSGELKQAAELAARFPKAAQQVEGMGSLPQMSPLDFSLGAMLSGATANPLMLASVAARPAARAATLSPMVQNRLVQGSGQNAIASLLSRPDARQLGYRVAPVLAGDR